MSVCCESLARGRKFMATDGAAAADLSLPYMGSVMNGMCWVVGWWGGKAIFGRRAARENKEN